ncbi:hypothetical protein OUZ56_021816 [Daphnia magna]|uniref:Uncharacterized protein n=1 Tax=Daphnia magna TaxID=35525 RepID=A0ABR0AUJ4_9CRUS|nr:hypothetical protein OUZ56_021816 [Daphnia magna]
MPFKLSSKTSYVARSPQMRKSHLCPSWFAAAAASYGETNFFIPRSDAELPRLNSDLRAREDKYRRSEFSLGNSASDLGLLFVNGLLFIPL